MKRYLLAAGAVLLFFGAPALAQQEYPGYCGYWGTYDRCYAPGFTLSADKQKRLADLEEKYRADLAAIDSQIEEKKLHLGKLMLAAEPDYDAVTRIEREILDLKDKRDGIITNYHNTVRSILAGGGVTTHFYYTYDSGPYRYHDVFDRGGVTRDWGRGR